MDDLLNRLGRAPAPMALDRIDDGIIAAWVVEQRERVTHRRILSTAALLAMGLGFAGGSISNVPAHIQPALSPLAASTFAPSVLLDSE